jgi:hypothetical protein
MEFGWFMRMVQKLLLQECEFQGRYMKMSGSLKPYLTALILILLAALLAGPPLAFATKLPTACNIFQEKKAAKMGACGHQVTFTNDKFEFGEMEFPAGWDSGNEEAPAVLNNHLFPPFISFLGAADLTPLRC